MAVHSEQIMNSAEIFPDLKTALGDIDRAIVLTRRFGRKKKIDYNPSEMAEYVHHSKGLKIALVFGRETFGLTDEEASLCQLRCYIPANDDFPSLNLSQAVAVTLYEIYSYQWKRSHRDKPARSQVVDETVQYVMEMFEQIGYFKDFAQDNVRHLLESLLYRANISKPTAYKIKAMFNRIHVLQKGKGFGYKITEKEHK